MSDRRETPAVSEVVQRRPVWIPLGALCLVVGVSVAASLFWRGSEPVPPEPDLAEAARKDLEKRNYRPLSEPLAALLDDPTYKPTPTQAHPLLGQPAPDFTLNDTNDKPVSLAESLRSGPVVLVFYYGYHCNHCVSQLSALEKDIDKFRELGVTVLAVSADAPELTRQRFQKYGAFAYPVLSDPGNTIATRYGTYAPSPKEGEEGELMHGTFVIGRSGRVTWANRGDAPFTENRTLLLQARRGERAGGAP